jgi:hypothetical protein
MSEQAGTTEDSIDDLIEQLELLRVEEATIITRIQQARAREQEQQRSSHTTRARGQEQQHTSATTGRTETARAVTASATNFTIGCRVKIINRIAKPASGRPTNENDRRAIVTRIVGDQIHFRTVNGTNTWRLPKNLRIVTSEETWE